MNSPEKNSLPQKPDIGDTNRFFEVTAPRLGSDALLRLAEESLKEGSVSDAATYIKAARQALAMSQATVPNIADLAWRNDRLVNLRDVQIHGLSHTLHYGNGAFEGIRFYNTAEGPAIFRLEEHVDRLIYSANVLQIELPWTKKQISDAIIETVRENLKGDAASHFPKGEGYIRPIIVLGPEKQGLSPTGAKTNLFVFAWDMGDYIKSDMLDVSLSNFARINPKTTIADAKICGHYVNSILAALELRQTGAHEALLLDCEGKLAEGAGENLFIVKGGEIHTPALGNILAGITRLSVIELARAAGITVHERDIEIEDLLTADEAFFTGTAAELKGIRSLNNEIIGDGRPGEITTQLRNAYANAVRGKLSNFKDWLTLVE